MLGYIFNNQPWQIYFSIPTRSILYGPHLYLAITNCTSNLSRLATSCKYPWVIHTNIEGSINAKPNYMADLCCRRRGMHALTSSSLQWKLAKLWKLFCSWKMIPLSKDCMNFILLHKRIWAASGWRQHGSILVVCLLWWIRNFSRSKQTHNKCQSWIQLVELPLKYWKHRLYCLRLLVALGL